MSDFLNHECGIALVRLLKPLEHYYGKYGTALYGLNKLHLLMQKQHNRGQDGAGIASIKYDLEPGTKYISRVRSKATSPITDIFNKIYQKLNHIESYNKTRLNDIGWLRENFDFSAELFLGHLRYGTYGLNKTSNLHPVARKNNWMTRNLVLAGNFNMTNVEELFEKLIELGQYPVETSDTLTILEKIGHFLDEENERLYQKFRKEGFSKQKISYKIAKDLNLQKILTDSCEHWDGGYVIAGMIGHGDAFVMRDECGIRPAYYYRDDEIIVAASERAVIQTALNVEFDGVKELKPGHALIIKKNGNSGEYQCKKPKEKRSCSFERIYFSRGSDKEIYTERKSLGKLLTPYVLQAIDHDLENTVFSYIPNTASVAFRGMVEELHNFCDQIKSDKLLELGKDPIKKKIDKILELKPRVEEVAVKDVKLRTFITQDQKREDLVAHVYDITYGSVRPHQDNLVVLDDSIVRGTTLRQSII
ncbi:MAG: amidophosphoribosyltransferase, partial [Bacteroidales bacterium]|nr:amidophosphoribosyltransferase [Bacteroidales bacterium]